LLASAFDNVTGGFIDWVWQNFGTSALEHSTDLHWLLANSGFRMQNSARKSHVLTCSLLYETLRWNTERALQENASFPFPNFATDVNQSSHVYFLPMKYDAAFSAGISTARYKLLSFCPSRQLVWKETKSSWRDVTSCWQS
jgi:hypothetical protein